MNKSIGITLFISIALFLGAFRAGAQHFFEYKLNGKPFTFTQYGVDFSSSVTSLNTVIGERNSKQLSIFIHPDSNLEYKVSVQFVIEIEAEFKVGKYPLKENKINNKELPMAYLEVSQTRGTNNILLFESNENSTGNLIITKISEDFVEGTFEGNVFTSILEADKQIIKSLTITEGKFKIPFDNLTFYR